MDNYSHEQLHTIVSSNVAQIYLLWIQIQSILINSEYFDAELSMQTVEAMKDFARKLDDLQRDSLYKMGYTEEQINEAVKALRKVMGLD